jgi:hypothetical protein
MSDLITVAFITGGVALIGPIVTATVTRRFARQAAEEVAKQVEQVATKAEDVRTALLESGSRVTERLEALDAGQKEIYQRVDGRLSEALDIIVKLKQLVQEATGLAPTDDQISAATLRGPKPKTKR